MSSDFLHRIGKLSPSRLALLALEQHEKLEALATPEPIAIVGLACRFPGGADDPAAYWKLLVEGRDAIREVPAERWAIDAWFDADPDVPGRMSVREGGFLDRVESFDAAFFGISPREAQTMDPQQRLVLEASWQALEHAGIAPASLAGSATGLFMGVCNNDHADRVVARGLETIDAYLASGNAHSVVSGRVAYFLGLKGPALSVDTACSSSLVALHLAVQSLRAGEVRQALAGGVNIMCSPLTTVALTKAHMLAPDGRCKTFDAAADGFSRGEGCGVLVLKRLRDAQADGDHVLALIRGCATNQDGRSGGLTVPSGPAQEAVIRAALADARLASGDIDYVEAHGTGTRLGDPIEVRALGAALGEGRTPGKPLLIGSVKTNIGHLESAAGVAGVIKVVLALQHGRIPPHLHFKQASPHIDWQRHPVQVAAEGCAWTAGAAPRRAGVSSFGFSGTNAHMVLEEAPQARADAAPGTLAPLHVLPLSARSRKALQAMACDYAALLVAPGADAGAVAGAGRGSAMASGPGAGAAADAGARTFADIAHSAGTGRSHFAERIAVVAADAQTAGAALLAFANGERHEALHEGSGQAGQASDFAFMYTGQGSQYPGMGTRLTALSPVVREVIERCDALLGADARGRTLTQVLNEADTGAGQAALHETAWTQPALFALELALTEQWRRWGVAPAAVIGHSVGEYAAACAAGVFTLEEGLALIAERGRLMQALPAGGAMAAFNAPADVVQAAVAAQGGQLAIAAFNAPDNLVVAGDATALEELLSQLALRDVQGQRLHVALAAHSPRVEPALAGLEAAARRVAMHAPAVPVAWNVTGGALEGAPAPDAAYWCRHLREPVRFADGLHWLRGQGLRHFIEVGPHPVLAALAERNFEGDQVHCIGAMRRGRDEWAELMHALAEAYVQGAAIDWVEVGRPHGARRVPGLPTYPFERQRYWTDAGPKPPGTNSKASAETSAAPNSSIGAGTGASDGPRAAPPHGQRGAAPAGAGALDGVRLPTALPVFEWCLRPDTPPGLGQHLVHGAALVAAPVFLEMAAAAARRTTGRAPRAFAGFEVHAPLVLPAQGRQVQLHWLPDGSAGAARFEIHSRAMPATDAGARSGAHTGTHSGAHPDADTGEAAAAMGWTHHASGQLGPAGDVEQPAPASTPTDLTALALALGPAQPCAGHYERLRAMGIELGLAFAPLQRAHRQAHAVLARLQRPEAVPAGAYSLAHPGLLDGALQAVGLALVPEGQADAATGLSTITYLMHGLQELTLHATPLPDALWCHARLRPAASAEPAEWLADVELLDDAGVPLGHMRGISLRRAAVASLRAIVAAARATPAAPAEAATDAVGSLGYEVRWEPVPTFTRAAPQLAAPKSCRATTHAAFDGLSAAHGLAVYETLRPELDRLSTAHVESALLGLGFVNQPGRRFNADSEAQALRIAAPHRRLFARLLRMLAEDGVLAAAGGGFECRRALQASTPEALAAGHAAASARFAPVDGELSTLRRCGPHLAAVLRGEQDALQLLFPGGSLAEARKLYVDSPFARIYNGALVAWLQAALGTLPAHARVRVLEVGAGTGGTTAYVLPLLAQMLPGRIEYTFTDLSPLFLERAAEQFAAYNFVRYQRLDIERDPATQGLQPGRHDIVIAANVLHATADLGQAVAHARSLLVPRGNLVVLEGTAPERWVDLTFGLTDGWWRFTDTALRRDYPLITRPAWCELLEGQGFEDIALFPNAPGPQDAKGDLAAPAPQQALIVARAAARTRSWQLVGGPPALAQALQSRLAARGDDVTWRPAHDFVEPNEGVDPGVGVGIDEWVYLGALELAVGGPDDAASALRCAILAVAAPARELGRLAAPARAWFVTQGVHPCPGREPQACGRWMAPLWGLARVFALEQPARWGGAIDLPAPGAVPNQAEPAAHQTQDPDHGLAQQQADLLLRSFDADDDEDQVAWNAAGQRHAARLAEAPIAAAAQPLRLRPDATYLVTGGFGGLGQLVARWLAERGAQHVALMGRRLPEPPDSATQALRGRGVQVVHMAGDIADEAFVDRLPHVLAEAGAPALAGVFHLAADLSHATIGQLTEAQVHAMLRPKIAGTLALQRLAARQRLDWLVLFSSTTALLGAGGLAHYAAANAFLDATAHPARRDGTRDDLHRGPRTLAIHWGTWAAMRLASRADQHDFRQAGLLPMSNEDALEAMARLMASGASHGVVARVDWPQLKALHEARHSRPFLRHLGQAPPVPTASTRGNDTPHAGPRPESGAGNAWTRKLAAAPAAARHEVLTELVQREVASVLAWPDSSSVPIATGLFDLGMDSLMAVELRRRLERAAGQPLPSTLTFNYPNVGALVGFLGPLLAPAPALAQAGSAPAAPRGAPRATQAITPVTPAAPFAEGADDRDLDALSDEELEARLLATLEKTR